jgi:hypothetical protein
MAARVPHLLRRAWARLRRRAAPRSVAYPPQYPGQDAIPDRAFYRPSEHGDWLFSSRRGGRRRSCAGTASSTSTCSPP